MRFNSAASARTPRTDPIIRRARWWSVAAILAFVFGVGLLASPSVRSVLGETVYFAVLMLLWYGPIFSLLKQFRVGIDWVEESRLAPPRAALRGALLGAAYCGLPTAVLFTAARAAGDAAGTPSEFAGTMSTMAFGIVLPSSLLVGAFWGALVGHGAGQLRPMKWRVRVLTGEDAEAQAAVIQSIIERYRLRAQQTAAEESDSIPVRSPELGEAIVADLWRAGINGEVVDAPA